MSWLVWITLCWGAVSEEEWSALEGQQVRLESISGKEIVGRMVGTSQDTVRIQRARDGALLEVRKEEVERAVDLEAPSEAEISAPDPQEAASSAPDPQEAAISAPDPQEAGSSAPDPQAADDSEKRPPPMPAPKLNAELLYRDGYTAGQLEAAREKTAGPLLISGCLVGGATAAGCMSPAPVLGCLLGLGTLGMGPAYFGLAWPLLEEPNMVAARAEEPAPYAVGYAQGYLAEAGRRKSQAAMLGGAAGLLVGAVLGSVVVSQRTL